MIVRSFLVVVAAVLFATPCRAECTSDSPLTRAVQYGDSERLAITVAYLAGTHNWECRSDWSWGVGCESLDRLTRWKAQQVGSLGWGRIYGTIGKQTKNTSGVWSSWVLSAYWNAPNDQSMTGTYVDVYYGASATGPWSSQATFNRYPPDTRWIWQYCR